MPEDLAAPRTPTLASTVLPRVWQGLGYRPLPDAAPARPLFDFAAVPWPESAMLAFAWGAFAPAADGERLVGALVAERAATTAFLYVVAGRVERPRRETSEIQHVAGRVERPGRETSEIQHTDIATHPLEVAAQLVAAAIDHASALGVKTVYARPQGLDRVWIRYGFMPVPEVALPAALAGRAGIGLYAWRGNSALWTLREAAHD